ncbi:MAG: DUF2608 domain-containing protein [Puniceicoccales bacterium]|nr:DUF2608 domain-containing protein [Puniceicoccales bacterium]
MAGSASMKMGKVFAVFLSLLYLSVLVKDTKIFKQMERFTKGFTIVEKMSAAQEQMDDLLKSYKGEDILCVFDIDGTLLQTDFPAVYVPNIAQHMEVYRTLARRYKQVDPTLAYMHALKLPQRLVEEDSLKLIQHLKEKNIKTIAFTATLTGPFENYQRAETLRYAQLNQYGINFEHTFAEKDFLLTNCPVYRSNYPSFYRGILFSNGVQGTTTKGTVLCTFLKTIDWTPKCVVFIDDRVKNLNDAKKSLRVQYPQTQFVGIEYQGACRYCPQTVSAEVFKQFWSECFQSAAKVIIWQNKS